MMLGRIPITEEGEFLVRDSRFSAVVRIGSRQERCHLSDTGRLPFLRPGMKVLLSPSGGKLRYKITAAYDREWVVLRPDLHSSWAETAFRSGMFGKFRNVRKEVKVGESRIDILADDFLVEAKGCMWKKGKSCLFPDSPSSRASKHLQELLGWMKKGGRAGFLFFTRRSCEQVGISDVDLPFKREFLSAVGSGLEVMAIRIWLKNGKVFGDENEILSSPHGRQNRMQQLGAVG